MKNYGFRNFLHFYKQALAEKTYLDALVLL